MSSKFAALELAVEKHGRMIINHPITAQPLRPKDGGDEPAYIDLFSADSPIAKKNNRNLMRNRLNMRGKGKLTPEQLEAEAIDLLVSLTVGWKLLALDGSPLDVPFTQENARELYASEAMSWLREQVDAYTSDRGNFSQASS